MTIYMMCASPSSLLPQKEVTAPAKLLSPTTRMLDTSGYFIGIDGYALEFDEREQAFVSEVRKYLMAIHDDRVRIKPRRGYLPKFITLRGSIYLMEE